MSTENDDLLTPSGGSDESAPAVRALALDLPSDTEPSVTKQEDTAVAAFLEAVENIPAPFRQALGPTLRDIQAGCEAKRDLCSLAIGIIRLLRLLDEQRLNKSDTDATPEAWKMITSPQVSTPKELSEAITMLFEAHREQDQFLIQAAMRHLTFLDDMKRLQGYSEGLTPSGGRSN